MCGKTLARNLEKLDEVARRFNLTPFIELISIDEEFAEDFLDDDLDNDDVDDDNSETFIAEQWFDPADGLATVTRLMAFVQENSEQFEQVAELLQDLSRLETSLSQAQQQGALFHLMPDL